MNDQDADMESNKMTKITGYRYHATGIFGYDFFKNKEKFCSVSSLVAPYAPVMIFGAGTKWRSDFPKCTIFPGLTGTVVDESDGNTVFRIH